VIIRKLSRITRKYGETGSTNEELNRLLENEILEEGTIVSTEYQTAGKGYQGNSWSSQKGKNLLFSILLKPEFLSPEKTFHLSRIISLSVIDILDKQGLKAEIKWPNDILIGSSKICGILIENAISGNKILHAVVGIGLNVNQDKFDREIPSPTSLCLEKGCHSDRDFLIEDFRSALESWYQVLLTGNENKIMDEYHKRLYLVDRSARYSDGKNDFRASILKVLPGGELEVLTEVGDTRRFGFKEIEYLGT
jgi:BirA family biotin operon repressor/biotin-[acetyl-CoA-carboxylase] ligase